MAIIADACTAQKGGRIISIIMCYNNQGSRQIQSLLNRLLKHILVPLIHFIKRWIYYGELNDTYEEFFIKEDTKISLENLWRKKYYIDKDLLPKFLDSVLIN